MKVSLNSASAAAGGAAGVSSTTPAQTNSACDQSAPSGLSCTVFATAFWPLRTVSPLLS